MRNIGKKARDVTVRTPAHEGRRR